MKKDVSFKVKTRNTTFKVVWIDDLNLYGIELTNGVYPILDKELTELLKKDEAVE